MQGYEVFQRLPHREFGTWPKILFPNSDNLMSPAIMTLRKFCMKGCAFRIPKTKNFNMRLCSRRLSQPLATVSPDLVRALPRQCLHFFKDTRGGLRARADKGGL